MPSNELELMPHDKLKHCFQNHFDQHGAKPYRVDPRRSPRATDRQAAQFTLYPVQCFDDLVSVLQHLPFDEEFAHHKYQAEFVVTPAMTLYFARAGGPSSTLPSHMQMSENVLSAGQIMFSNDFTQIVGLGQQSQDFPFSYSGHYMWPLAILNQLMPERIENLNVYHGQAGVMGIYECTAVSQIKQAAIASLLPSALNEKCFRSCNDQNEPVIKNQNEPVIRIPRPTYGSYLDEVIRSRGLRDAGLPMFAAGPRPRSVLASHVQTLLAARQQQAQQALLAAANATQVNPPEPVVSATESKQPAINGKRARHGVGFYSEANQARIKEPTFQSSKKMRTGL